MSDFDDRNTRTNTFRFGHGSVTVAVDHWTDYPCETVEIDLDHVMATVVTAAYDDITALNKAVEKSGGNAVKHTSTRSMCVNDGTSMRIKVTVNLDSPMSTMSLAGYVETILSKAAACMLHVIDPEAMDEVKPNSLLDILKSAGGVVLGGMPPEMADLFGSGFGQSPYADAGSHRTADAGSNTGQYL